MSIHGAAPMTNPAGDNPDRDEIPSLQWEERSLLRRTILSKHAWMTYILASFAAIFAGFGAFYFHLAEGWSMAFFDFIQGRSEFWGMRIPGWLGLLLPGVATIGGMMLIMRIRDKFFPGTEGTGIPQAIAALHTPEGPLR